MIYTSLLTALKNKGYRFIPFFEYCKNQNLTSNLILRSSAGAKGELTSQLSPLVILRHDVDRLPENSIRIAALEHSLNISGSYYFRIVPESWNESIIKEIASLVHEIGYHYEDLSLVNSSTPQLLNFTRSY